MSELVSSDLGKYAHVAVKFEGGALVAAVSVPLHSILDELAAKVKAVREGGFEDAAVDLLVAALKSQIGK